MPEDTTTQLRSKIATVYHIEVDGHLGASWSGRLAGMHISLRRRSNLSPVTILSGRLGDQTQLTVMLDNLIKKHLPILSVVIVKPKSEADGGSPIDQ